jgi:phosphoribosyl-AMP cyclohydrolase
MSIFENVEETDSLQLQFEKRGGLLPVVVQHAGTKEVLMLGYTNQEAFEYTIKHKIAAFWSTSRQELWVKGKTSGNTLHVKEIRVDCDQDALVYIADLEGVGVCHTKNNSHEFRTSCFYRSLATTDNSDHKLTFLEI